MEKHNTTPVTLTHETATQLKALFASSEFDFEEPQQLENDLWRMLSHSIAYDSALENVSKANMVTSCKTSLKCWQVMQRLHKEMPYDTK